MKKNYTSYRVNWKYFESGDDSIMKLLVWCLIKMNKKHTHHSTNLNEIKTIASMCGKNGLIELFLHIYHVDSKHIDIKRNIFYQQHCTTLE